MGIELTANRHSPITSQTRYPPRYLTWICTSYLTKCNI